MRRNMRYLFYFQAEDGIRDIGVTGVQTCALPICRPAHRPPGNPVQRLDPLMSFFVAIALALVLTWGARWLGLATGLVDQIGRASRRERVQISVVAVSLKKK